MRASFLIAVTLFACSKDPILTPDREAMHFVAVDSGGNQVHMVDQIRGTTWSAEVPSGARDISAWGEDEVMVSHSQGATRFDLETGEETWSLERYTGIGCAQPLDGGGVLLAGQYGDVLKVYNIDRFDEQVAERTLINYRETRLIRENTDGHLVFTTGEPWRVVEVDGFTNEVWTTSLPARGYQAERTPDDTVLASTDTDLRVLEIARNGNVLRSWNGSGLASAYGLASFRGFARLDDLMVIANYVGNEGEEGDAHILAMDEEGEVVWTWEDHETALAVTHVLPLEYFQP
jgi:hypothetical protein